MRGSGAFIRDNLEAFAVAIALALVIRHFSLEAFRIPTGSMKPTLYGDDMDEKGRRRHGDRILVDKTAWMVRDPRRFEVAVFHYPLNHNQNFIKRIAGMPGEWLTMAGGDIWTSRDKGATWSIPRKPTDVQEQLFFPYYPEPPRRENAFRGLRCWDHGDGWRVNERKRRFEVDAGDEDERLTFNRRILPYDEAHNRDYDPGEPYVGDVRVSFDLAVERAGTLRVVLTEHGWPYLLVLSPEESYVEFATKKTRHPLDVRLEDGADYCVSFANVDDVLIVDIDGDRAEFAHPNAPTQPLRKKRCATMGGQWMEHRIDLEARNCRAVVEDLRIERDVHYCDPQRTNPPDFVWRVPDDSYFMLGDNTQSSSDSRKWFVVEAIVKGEAIRWTSEPTDGSINASRTQPRSGTVEIESDVDGLTRSFPVAEIEGWEKDVRWSFVTRDHLIGRAFSVFWPFYLPPLSTGPTRIKLIR